MVYRGGERSHGYNFYVQSGHRDLIYIRQAGYKPPAALRPTKRSPRDGHA